MNRRKFIQNASLATAGGVIAGSLPAWASGLSVGTKHVVLAVVAGISREDFVQLFPKTFPQSLGSMGHLIEDMRYNGRAAGHRLAFESILEGRYLPETETGKKALTKTTLLATMDVRDKNHLVTADREFLKTCTVADNDHAFHFCVKPSVYTLGTPTRSTRPYTYIKNTNPAAAKANQVYEELLNENWNPAYDMATHEDELIAETACILLEKEAPRVLVVHFMGADAGHADTDLAKKNHRGISMGLQRIWETITYDPQKDNILLLVIPDFGRNFFPNSIHNADGKFGTDHSIADENTKKIACLLASPKGLPKKMASSGESIDVLPTLLHFLGAEIPAELPGKNLL